MTLADFADVWQATLPRLGLKPRTVTLYRRHLKLHILREPLGPLALEQITRRHIREWLLELRRDHKRASVANILAVLSQLLNAAVDEELIPFNAARGMGKSLRLGPKAVPERIKAFSREELGRFLHTCEQHLKPCYGVLFKTLVFAGLRPGEALALEWDDVGATQLSVSKTWAPGGEMGTTKTGRSRLVDIVPELATALAQHRLRMAGSRWVFARPTCHYRWPLHTHTMSFAFKRALLLAGLAPTFTPHGLRHTYASLLLSEGESIQYVQQQLGHRTVTLTVDLYGKWIPAQRRTPLRNGGVTPPAAAAC